MITSSDDRAWARLVELLGPYVVFVLIVVIAYIGYVIGATVGDSANWATNMLVGAIFAGSSILLMWLARRAWRLEGYVTLRAILAGVIGYHALFGVTMLTTRFYSPISRNDDFVMRLWPHVVHWINSFE